MSIKRTFLLFLISIVFCLSCQQNSKSKEKREANKHAEASLAVRYAKSFSIENYKDYTVLQVNKPWPGVSKPFRYVVIEKETLARQPFSTDSYDALITTPIKTLIATSTTHIPALESLGALNKLVGFPDTKYISSMPARDLIAKGKIQELGNNQTLNTEMVVALHPDVIIGFGIDNQNSAYDVFKKAGIPVVFNGDWTEETPLGKAEWIKFFGVLLDKKREADSLFTAIEAAYLDVKELASKATNKPSVLSGALYKDVWYLPNGNSWAAQFIKDANGAYLFDHTTGSGSLSLSLESVLEKGKNAAIWVAPSQFTSFNEMNQANTHYKQFKAFQDKKVYTFANTKGATGGLLYYELAPQRPDLVLKDLVHFFHPDVLPNHTPFFFTPLQ